jgi:hypothetical protein
MFVAIYSLTACNVKALSFGNERHHLAPLTYRTKLGGTLLDCCGNEALGQVAIMLFNHAPIGVSKIFRHNK